MRKLLEALFSLALRFAIVLQGFFWMWLYNRVA